MPRSTTKRLPPRRILTPLRVPFAADVLRWAELCKDNCHLCGAEITVSPNSRIEVVFTVEELKGCKTPGMVAGNLLSVDLCPACELRILKAPHRRAR